MTGPVVVGLDGQEAGRALAYGSVLARALDSELVAVHALDAPLAFPYGNRRIQELQRRKALAEGKELVREVARSTGVVVGDIRVVFAEPAEALRKVAAELEAALVVVAPRARGRIAAALSAGISRSVAASSPCPVVVIPPGVRVDRPRRIAGAPIVVAADGPATSARAVAVANALSEPLQLPVLPVGIEAGAEEAGNLLRHRNSNRDPGEALAEIARRVRGALLVVGATNGSRLSGSIAQRLIAGAPVPLVVVPEGVGRG